MLCAVLTGCASSPRPLSEVLPTNLPGGWTRGDVSARSDAAPMIVQLGHEESAETTYTGRGTVTLRGFRMRSETSAFELVQKWRQSEGLAAYKGPYFFVATGEGAAEVLRELQRIISQ
jgi:hypothetical protein